MFNSTRINLSNQINNSLFFSRFTNTFKRFSSIHIPDRERERITQAFLEIKKSPYQEENITEIQNRTAEILGSNLPPRILNEIFYLHGSTKGFLEITGTPQDHPLVDTPKDLESVEHDKKSFLAEYFSLGISGILGFELFNFRQEAWGTGKPIFNIFPDPNKASIKGAGGTFNNFGFHMENAWHSKTPDFLLLKGVRQDHNGEAVTYLASNQEIDEQLSTGAKKILRGDLFRVVCPEIHKKMESEKGIILAEDSPYVGPAIIEEGDGLKFIVNLNGMEPVIPTDQNLAALNELETVAMKIATKIKLKGDTIAIVNNKRALHTRNGFTPKYDGKDRWFQRYFLIHPNKLWDQSEITVRDFAFLSPKLANEFENWLYEIGILKHSKLAKGFRIEYLNELLPKKFEPYKQEISKVLIRKGPAFPNRQV